MDSSTSLKPNDIALILRPTIVDGVYQKHFQVLVSGFGPLTISEDDKMYTLNSGVTELERKGIWNTMAQIFDNDIAPYMEFK